MCLHMKQVSWLVCVRHESVLRVYFQLCSQKSLPVLLRGSCAMWGIKSGFTLWKALALVLSFGIWMKFFSAIGLLIESY